MSLTNRQKMLLHRVPQDLRIPDCDRLTIQRTCGGFESAADPDASHEGFVAVMAHYERVGEGKLNGFTPGFWAAAHATNEREGGGAAGRLRYAIGRQAAEMCWAPERVDGFLQSKHCSSGAFDSIREASVYWLGRCLDGMRAIAKRTAMGSQGVSP